MLTITVRRAYVSAAIGAHRSSILSQLPGILSVADEELVRLNNLYCHVELCCIENIEERRLVGGPTVGTDCNISPIRTHASGAISGTYTYIYLQSFGRVSYTNSPGG